MDDFEVLYDLLRRDALAPVENLRGRPKTITLEESGQQGYVLKLLGTPNDTIAFKADKFPPPEGLFENSRHECKRADYVVIARHRNRKWIVYIEMKSGKGNTAEVKQQLRGAKCLVTYCRAIVQEFWEEHGFLRGFAERFVSVREIRIAKRSTREPRAPVHDNPDDMLTMSAPKGTIHFQKLL